MWRMPLRLNLKMEMRNRTRRRFGRRCIAAEQGYRGKVYVTVALCQVVVTRDLMNVREAGTFESRVSLLVGSTPVWTFQGRT